MSSRWRWAGADLWDEFGNHMGSADADSSGRYTFHLPDSGGTARYYVTSTNDQSFHVLAEECWDDVKYCSERCRKRRSQVKDTKDA